MDLKNYWQATIKSSGILTRFSPEGGNHSWNCGPSPDEEKGKQRASGIPDSG
jgi:hypothetical protein